MMKEMLFNPFLRIAGLKSLFLGFLGMALTAIAARFSHCHFDGVLDAHIGADTPVWFYAAEPLIAWICIAFFLYLAGLFCSKSAIRLVDVAGTLAFSRWPMIFVALLAFIPVRVPQAGGVIEPSFLFFSFTLLPFPIWMIALMYRAFIISCNLKGSRAIVLFTISLILAEISSKLIFSILYKNNSTL